MSCSSVEQVCTEKEKEAEAKHAYFDKNYCMKTEKSTTSKVLGAIGTVLQGMGQGLASASGQNAMSSNTNSYYSSSGGCVTHSQCGYNKSCVKTLGMSLGTCTEMNNYYKSKVEEVDNYQHTVQRCYSDGDCYLSKCDTKFGICIKY